MDLNDEVEMMDLKDEVARLRDIVDYQRGKIALLNEENGRLREEIAKLRETNKNLMKNIGRNN